MNERLFFYVTLMLGILVSTSLHAQSLPQPSHTLRWADLGSDGRPTGTFNALTNLSTVGDFASRYVTHVNLGADGLVSPGDAFTGTFRDTDPNHSLVHWPGVSADGDYRLEAVLAGTVTQVEGVGTIGSAGLIAPVDPDFPVSPNPTFNVLFNDNSHIRLINNHTNELIADLPVQTGEGSNLHLSGTIPIIPINEVPGTLTLTAKLDPGCVVCDQYIQTENGGHISNTGVVMTFSGPVLNSVQYFPD